MFRLAEYNGWHDDFETWVKMEIEEGCFEVIEEKGKSVMTNLEKIKSLTVEEMAHLNVRAFSYMNGYRVATDFYTTDQSVFPTREEAEEYEIKWLNGDLDTEIFDTLLFKK